MGTPGPTTASPLRREASANGLEDRYAYETTCQPSPPGELRSEHMSRSLSKIRATSLPRRGLSGGQIPMHLHIEVSLTGADRYAHKCIEVLS